MQKRQSTFSLRGFRRELASIESAPQFALLGIIAGTVTGLVILGFRLMIEIPLALFLQNDFEDFESVGAAYLVGIPIAGSIVLAIMFALIPADSRRVGVVHVLDRLSRHQGHLPLSNALTQFFGGIIALGSGFSGGREGPAIHLGAACSSLLGQKLKLPNNSIRILVGCGAAAAISASFNTPLAGVIFSMEVIIMEYTVAGFIPVILASVIATLINQGFYGNVTAFDIQLETSVNSIFNLPFVLAEGIFIGTLAAVFVYILKRTYQLAPAPHWQRILIAGLVTGLVALACPQILGIGYDTINQAASGELAFTLLLTICILKLVLSALTVGLGVPVGIIGPTLFIGAAAGGLMGFFGEMISPDLNASPGFYVLLGMGAMMGAVLQAPLAALMAVMELTHNPNIILPAMLVIIVANMTASQVFKIKSVFLTQMEIMGLELRQDPLSMTLNRSSVASIMTREFTRVSCVVTREYAIQLNNEQHAWFLVDNAETKRPAFILRSEDLATFLDNDPGEEIDLANIPATRKDVSAILLQATLSEALDCLNTTGLQALYVNRISAPMTDSVVGILTREDIESFYQV